MQINVIHFMCIKALSYCEEEEETVSVFSENMNVAFGSFLFPPPLEFFFGNLENLITNRFDYKPESFSFKFILSVIV